MSKSLHLKLTRTAPFLFINEGAGIGWKELNSHDEGWLGFRKSGPEQFRNLKRVFSKYTEVAFQPYSDQETIGIFAKSVIEAFRVAVPSATVDFDQDEAL